MTDSRDWTNEQIKARTEALVGDDFVVLAAHRSPCDCDRCADAEARWVASVGRKLEAAR
jgi:hypothetical protein